MSVCVNRNLQGGDVSEERQSPGPDVSGVFGAIILAWTGVAGLVFGLVSPVSGGWVFAAVGVGALGLAVVVLLKALRGGPARESTSASAAEGSTASVGAGHLHRLMVMPVLVVAAAVGVYLSVLVGSFSLPQPLDVIALALLVAAALALVRRFSGARVFRLGAGIGALVWCMSTLVSLLHG